MLKRKKYENAAGKVHPLAYVVLVFFLVLISITIVFITPSAKTRFTNEIQKNYSNLKFGRQLANSDKYTRYLPTENIYIPISQRKLYSVLEKSKTTTESLVFAYYGTRTHKNTLENLGPINEEFTRLFDGYENAQTKVEKDEEFAKVTGKKIYFLDLLKKPVEIEDEKYYYPDYKNFKKKYPGLYQPKYSQTMLVFYKGELLDLSAEEQLKTTLESHSDIRLEVQRFIELIAKKTFRK